MTSEDPESEGFGPLAGVRVLDLTHVLNGPFATMMLAHMGAEVLKVEHGEGDRFRHAWMPLDADHDGYEFLAVNTNKKCITLNMKSAKGREIFLELVGKSDVIVENFSFGVMERLGFGYDSLKKVNPRIIYATSKGYGESGPYASVRSFAPIAMATSGWTQSAWNTSGARGTKVLGIGDEAAGVSMAVGICAALYRRSVSGVGQKLEVSMQEAQMGFLVSSFHTHFEGQEVGAPYYECKNGHIITHLPDLSDELFARYVRAMGHPEALEDPRFATPILRRGNYQVLAETMREWMRDKTKEELFEILRGQNLAAGPVLSLGEVIENEHVNARGAFTEIEHPEAGVLKLVNPWIRFSDTPARITHAGPAVGEHNYEVYQDLLGLTRIEVDALIAAGDL
jgi:crotonobetainyl-CoA:carnitine CoA-transferase CaiB-like acyl-CoA transferase